jgi:HicB family
MRQITLRVPDELHDLAASAAQAQGQSLNSFATGAILAQVRARSFSEWRQMVEDSHRGSNFRGLSTAGLDALRSLTGNEDS